MGITPSLVGWTVPRRLLLKNGATWMLLMAAVVWMMSHDHAAAQSDQVLYLTTGETRSVSYRLGVGISTLIKMFVLPDQRIDMDTIRATTEAEQASSLVANEAQFALMSDPGRVLFNTDALSIMAFWRGEDEDKPALQLVVSPEVDDATVYSITSALMDNNLRLARLDERETWMITIDRALEGTSLPLHPGAAQYYSELGVSDFPDAGSTDRARRGRIDTHLIYFPAKSAELDEEALSRLSAICKDAAALEDSEIEVISPLQSSEEGVDKTLARVRSAAIMKALEKEETCRRLEDLDIALGSTSTLPDISAAFGLTSQHIEVAVVRKFK